MSQCPFCETQMESMPDTIVECPKCKSKWLVSIGSTVPHAFGEIDSFFHDRHRGPQQTVLHPPGTRCCPVCSDAYPENHSCCPELLVTALKLLCLSKAEHGPTTEAKALRLLTQHRDVLEMYVKQVNKSGSAEEIRLLEDSNISWIFGLKQ